MDRLSSSPNQAPLPRLRLTRQNWASTSGDTVPPRQAGLTVDDGNMFDDEDEESTPRRPPLEISGNDSPNASEKAGSTASADTPAARLRALLARIPNSSTPKAVAPPSPTEIESDFDPPESSSPQNNNTTQASARDSLRNIFSRALREPGETPMKDRLQRRPRRNSIGSSGIEESPVKTRVKRQSLSDEEAEKSTIVGSSEKSARSSSAVAFDSLRARLAKTNSANETGRNDQTRQKSVDMEIPAGSNLMSMSLASIPSPSSPPVATSTPLRQSESVFPSQFSGSNLLNEDSSLQRFIRENEHTEPSNDDLIPRQRSMSTPQPRPGLNVSSTHHNASGSPSTVQARSSLRRPLSRQQSHESVGSSSSRASSSQSIKPSRGQVHEKNHEREKGWNNPKPPHSRTHSSAFQSYMLNRKGSNASLTGSESGHSPRSRASSTGSQDSVHNPSARDSQPSTKINTPHTRSGLPPVPHSRDGNRTRTMSQPTRPSSSLSRLQPDQTNEARPSSVLARHRSSPSVHLTNHSFRTHSPASSISSNESIPESEYERQMERERNWNSPLPTWDFDPILKAEAERQHSRSVSPMLNTPQPPQHSHKYERHDQGMYTNGDGADEEDTPRQASIEEFSAFGRSLAIHSTPNGAVSHIPHAKSRPVSASPSLTVADPAGHDKASASGNHSSRSVSLRESSRSQTDMHESVPEDLRGQSHLRLPSSPSPTPAHRPDSRSNAKAGPSHIPVRARKLSDAVPDSPGKRGHRRTTTELSHSAGRGPPKVSVASTSVRLNGNGTGTDLSADSGSEQLQVPGASVHGHSLPSAKTLQTYATSPSSQLSSPPNTPDDENAPVLPDLPSVSHLVSQDHRGSVKETMRSEPSSLPRTPLKSLNKVPYQEFKTPSPPQNMPDLPEPPPSEDDEDTDRTPTTPLRVTNPDRFINLKTPRPPGAWSTPGNTPGPPRSYSLPTDDLTHALPVQTPPYTPPASLSRATSLPSKTPAPPGAWATTPASLRRKMPLKVRFDDQAHETEQSVSQSGSVDDSRSNSCDLPPSPPRPSPRSSRRSSGIRILDAFGKEISQVNNEANQGKASTEEIPTVSRSTGESDSKLSPARRRNTIRVLDAMGRVIQEPSSEIEVDSRLTQEKTVAEDKIEERLDPQQAKQLLQQTVLSLRDDVEALERESSILVCSDAQLADLQEQSLKAREVRTQIHKQMQRVAELAASAKFSSSNLSKAIVPAFTRTTIRSTVFWIFVQLAFAFIMWRLSISNAQQLFLTTYYDPFYPELHLHLSPSDLVRLSVDSTQPWGSLVYDTAESSGWQGALIGVWHQFLNTLSFLRYGLSEQWTDIPRGTTWTPT